MADKLKEYLNENPDLQEYIVDGKINWSSLGIDLEYEQLTNPGYVDEVSLFIDVTTLL